MMEKQNVVSLSGSVVARGGIALTKPEEKPDNVREMPVIDEEHHDNQFEVMRTRMIGHEVADVIQEPTAVRIVFTSGFSLAIGVGVDLQLDRPKV